MKEIAIKYNELREIIGNAIVYSDYNAGNHPCQVVRSGAKEFSKELEQKLLSLEKLNKKD